MGTKFKKIESVENLDTGYVSQGEFITGKDAFHHSGQVPIKTKTIVAGSGVMSREKAQTTFQQAVDREENVWDFIERTEKWCPRFNSESALKKKKISNIMKKPYYQPVKEFLRNNQIGSFGVSKLIKEMGYKGITSGQDQREVISSMICQGNISREMNINDKTKKIKSSMFLWKKESLEPCPFLKNSKCSFDWKSARETKHYKARFDELRKKDQTESFFNNFDEFL